MEFASCIEDSTDQDPRTYCECQLGRIMTEAKDQVFLFSLFISLAVSTFQFCLPVFVDIHRHPRQKEFFKYYDAFLRAALTRHDHPSPFWKIAKTALFNPCMKFKKTLGQITSFKVLWKCHQVTLPKHVSGSIQVF